MSTVIARRILYVFSCFILIIVFSSGFKERAYSSVSSCTASLVTPSSVDASSTSDFSFSITNGDEANSLVWIKITRPSSNFTIETGGVSDSYTDTSTSIGPGGFTTTTFSATTGSINASSANWTVMVSDDPEGLSPTQCTGELGSAIVNGTDAITISNVTLSEVTTTSVKISWTTSVAATSVVDYGATSSYGSSKSDATLSTSHAITLDSISANTSYHYRITSTDASSNTIQTSDNTFTTAASSTSTTTTVTSVVTVTKQVPNSNNLLDSLAPKITLNTSFEKPFSQTPVVSGKVIDNKGVQKIEYSFDNGKNWAPVDTISKNNSASSFSFTLAGLDDDNYQLKVRATDTSGNSTTTKTNILVIDKLKPLVGAVITSIGPQIVPTINGFIYGLAGLDQKITLSSVGGSTSIDVVAGSSTFSLVRNLDSDLWSGIFSFEKPGIYPIEVKSIDGAGNKTVRKLNSIKILPAGTVTDGKKPVSGAIVSVYYRDVLTKKFILWDGSPYGQQNPQKTDKDGKYVLFMPPGTYYIEIGGPNFKSVKSEIITLKESLPINDDFLLKEKDYLNLGIFRLQLPDLSSQIVGLSLESQKDFDQSTVQNKMVNKPFPDIILSEGSSELESTFLEGKQTVITILNTWDPNASLQLEILGKVNISEWDKVAIFEQEQGSKIAILKSRGGYKFRMLADKNGELISQLDINSLPVHVFVNRKGIIQKIHNGILSQDELAENLIH